MSIRRVVQIMRALRAAHYFPMGQGWLKVGQIVYWSGLSYSTTYRYMAKLEKLGYVEKLTRHQPRGMVMEYRLTNEGFNYIREAYNETLI